MTSLCNYSEHLLFLCVVCPRWCLILCVSLCPFLCLSPSLSLPPSRLSLSFSPFLSLTSLLLSLSQPPSPSSFPPPSFFSAKIHPSQSCLSSFLLVFNNGFAWTLLGSLWLPTGSWNWLVRGMLGLKDSATFPVITSSFHMLLYSMPSSSRMISSLLSIISLSSLWKHN